MVIVNTVVIVKGSLSRGDGDVALTLASFGAGSMLAALNLPRLLEQISDRKLMLTAAGVMGLILGVSGFAIALLPGSTWFVVLMGWFALGIAYSAVLTPGGRLLRRSAYAPDRPAVFAAHFALSHACWLFTYPLAGWLGASLPLPTVFMLFAVITASSVAVAAALWPVGDPETVAHNHADLPADHPHLLVHATHVPGEHAHAYVIDGFHTHWPTTR